MTSGRLVRALVGGLVIVVVAVMLRFDALALAPRPLVLYAGTWSPDRDPSYGSYLGAVKRLRPDLPSFAIFEFLGLPDDDDPAGERILAAAIKARHPALVIAPTGAAAIAMHKVAPTVPCIFASYVDPVRSGIVASMRARREPVTGISVADWLDGKRLEILHEAYPSVRSIAVVGDHAWEENFDGSARLPVEAAHLGLRATVFLADSEAQLLALMDDPASRNFDAWYFPPTYVEYVGNALLIRRLRQWGKPAIFPTTEEVRDGALMSYAQDTAFVWPMLAELTARVLEGESPGSIPIVRPQRFVLAVRTGADIGLSPPDIVVVRRADIVVR